jgi:hypothetical protein
MLRTFPTIVTSIYNIRKTEINETNTRNITKYLELANDFILSLPYPLIIFTDDNDIIDFLKEKRTNFKEITTINKIAIENTEYYQYFDKLKELHSDYIIYNLDKNKDTPLYITLTNNKFYFLETAVKTNPFQSSHFIWMDFGINHCARNCEKIHEWIIEVPDKIKQLCINPFLEEVDDYSIFFQYVYHHLASGVFSGSSENILKYCELFKEKTQQTYNEGWFQLEEAIMTIIHRENPELFELYYGDYNGIISNYLTPIDNIDLIIDHIIPKTIVHQKQKMTYDILMYLLHYFKHNETSNYLYKYIEFHIIFDYYFTNKFLLHEVIYLINKKLLENDGTMKQVLQNNIENLNFYENKQLILYDDCIMKPIYGVYFICCINNYLDIVKEQLSCLNKGLLSNTYKLIIFVTNYNENDCVELDKLLHDNEKFILIKSPHNLYEKFAINNYKKYINHNKYYLYYFHTKGLKPEDDPLIHIFSSRRQILNYYTLEMYKINIELLDKNDAVGCSLSLYPKKHFSGNFWWSKSSHLNLLQDINDKYLSPEMYVLSKDNCKYVSLANDTNDILIENYVFRSAEMIKTNITDDFIVIEQHKSLISMC